MATTTSRREWQEPLVQRLIAKHRGRDPEAIIERYADELRATADQDELPIDVKLISSVKGIRRRRGSHEFAGRIYAEANGQLVMNINRDDIPARQVFTEAHELMHTAFPGFKHEKRYRVEAPTLERSGVNREEEYLCDYGAAALLMPAELVRGRFSVAGGLADAEELSRIAAVSVEAALNRLVALADEPAIVLCLVLSHKPADQAGLRRGDQIPEKVRVRYAFSRHLDTYVPRFKAAEESSVLSKALEVGGIQEATEALPGAGAELFRLQAKCYGSGVLQRILAAGRPTA